MVSENVDICPICSGKLRYYDSVKRIILTKQRKKIWTDIRRLKCQKCGVLHREIPEIIFPFKHYEAEVILGVLEGFITTETLGFEDYPCEATMERWRNARNLQGVL